LKEELTMKVEDVGSEITKFSIHGVNVLNKLTVNYKFLENKQNPL
jgi:hypothetical protein